MTVVNRHLVWTSAQPVVAAALRANTFAEAGHIAVLLNNDALRRVVARAVRLPGEGGCDGSRSCRSDRAAQAIVVGVAVTCGAAIGAVTKEVVRIAVTLTGFCEHAAAVGAGVGTGAGGGRGGKAKKRGEYEEGKRLYLIKAFVGRGRHEEGRCETGRYRHSVKLRVLRVRRLGGLLAMLSYNTILSQVVRFVKTSLLPALPPNWR